MIFSQYTEKNVEDSLNDLKSSKKGLTKKEAVLAQEKYGLNEIKVRNVNALNILIRQFKSPFCYLLLIAALISIILRQIDDSIAVLAFILINVFLGFFQEYRAEKAVSLLQKFITQKVKVLRDSKEEVIEKIFLVPLGISLIANTPIPCSGDGLIIT